MGLRFDIATLTGDNGAYMLDAAFGLGPQYNQGSVSGTVTFNPNAALAAGVNGVGTILFSPSADLTGAIISLGTVERQRLVLVNESASFYLTFAAVGTSNVAGGTDNVIAPNSAATFLWDSNTSLWVPLQGSVAPQIVQGGAIATAGTITPGNAPVVQVRLQPAAAVTGVILALGAQDGQELHLVNESAFASSVTFAAQGTSNVAGGAAVILPGNSELLLFWSVALSLWVAAALLLPVPTVGGAIANSATLTPSTAAYSKITVNPGGAVTGIILAAGVLDGQEVTIVNLAAAGNTVTFAAVGTSHVADGAGSAIVGLTARTLIWDVGAALWFREA